MDLPDNDTVETSYSAIARFFHWVIAFLMIAMLVLGLTMGTVNYGLPGHQVVDLHKSIGVVILLLAIGRIIWRFASIPPEALDTHEAWERLLAKAVHRFLYFAMIAMPLTGWLMSSAGGRPPSLFGLPLPRLIGYDETLMAVFRAAHEWIAYGVMAAIGLHVAGALKHHLIDGDLTLRRMAGDRLQWFKAVFVVLLIDLALSAAAFLFLSHTVLDRAAPASAELQGAAGVTLDFAALPGHGWAIDHANSTLGFESKAMGETFQGTFGSFDGTIIFNRDDLSDARVDIVIVMNDFATGDRTRDDMLLAPAWFDSNAFPQARYTAGTIEPLSGDRYVAIGELTIRDVTMPLTLPFTLTFSESGTTRTAHMQADISISRLDFGVGQGEWQSTEAVPDDVRVTIDLKARQPR